MPEDIFQVEQPATPQHLALLRGLVTEVVELDTSLTELKQQEKKLREEKTSKVAEAIKILTDAGVKSEKWVDGLMVTRRTNKYPNVTNEHWPRFKRWLMRNKYWGLAKINASTLRSILKERIEKEQRIPDYVTIHEEDSLSISGKSAVRRANR